jgi:uncharacterized protein (TIGR03118 family)
LFRKEPRFFTPILITAIALCVIPKTLLCNEYLQTNLVSDIPGMATTTDPNLKNAWGISFGTKSPFWVSDQATSVSTLYGPPDGSTIVPLVVSVPSGGPTGQVFNSTSGFKSAAFIFATIGGAIYAWNPSNGTSAQPAVPSTGSVFTGLALGGDHLFAADFRSSGGGIKVFDSSFTPVTLSGSFTDPNVPSGYAPYNVQMLNGKLYVEYAQVGSNGFPVFGNGLGYVGVFDFNGKFLSTDPGNLKGAPLNSPWGITFAPSGFGDFANDLLVGNLGNGWINAFNPTTGAFVGTLNDEHGNPVAINGLWALTTREPGSGFDTNAVFFSAGPNLYADGLFGKLDPVPEPVSWGLGALGFVTIGLLSLRKRFQAR